MDTILTKDKPNPKTPKITPGDSVRVSTKIGEGEKGHAQVFHGVVIKVRRGGDGGSFTIRRVSHGIGVEHTFSFASPLLAKIDVVRRGRVRRARLYYLRGLSSRASRTKEKQEKE